LLIATAGRIRYFSDAGRQVDIDHIEYLSSVEDSNAFWGQANVIQEFKELLRRELSVPSPTEPGAVWANTRKLARNTRFNMRQSITRLCRLDHSSHYERVEAVAESHPSKEMAMKVGVSLEMMPFSIETELGLFENFPHPALVVRVTAKS
jgi:hypothetical protein